MSECKPEPKWGIAFGTIQDGFSFVGPFEDYDSNGDDPAEIFAETCNQFHEEYHYFQIYSPDDFEKDHYGDLLFKKDKNA